jgi:hypothetical protein
LFSAAGVSAVCLGMAFACATGAAAGAYVVAERRASRLRRLKLKLFGSAT